MPPIPCTHQRYAGTLRAHPDTQLAARPQLPHDGAATGVQLPDTTGEATPATSYEFTRKEQVYE